MSARTALPGFVVSLAIGGLGCERAPTATTTAPPAPAAVTPATLQRAPLDVPDFFAEGLAWDEAGKRVLLGGIVGQSIVATALEGGAATPFATPPRGWSVFGLAVDRERGLVWAACSSVPQGRALPADVGRAGLLAFALADGKLVHERLTPEGDGAAHLFGDLALRADGHVVVTDSAAGGVYWTSAEQQDLREVAPAGTFRSAQGVVIVDARTLVVADYSAGLVRLELGTDDVATGASVLPLPEGEDLRGIDGLAGHGRAIVAVQNGAVPHRILRVELAEDAKRVTAVEVLHEIPSTEGEPTLATIVGAQAWVMQTDRWDRVFDPSGRPREGLAIAPPVILRLPFAGD